MILRRALRLRIHFLKGIGVFAALGLTTPALAQKKPLLHSWEQRFIRGNIAVSEWLDGVAEGLDLFLVGKDISDRRNDTSVTLRNSTYSVEGENVSNRISLSVNPRLPNLEEYWQLKFTSYDEREEARGVRRGYLRQDPREENYGATIGLIRRLGNVRTSFQPRIELQDPLRVSHSLTFESLLDLEKVDMNPKVEFFAKPDKGVGIFTALNLNYQISPKYSFTLINEGEYEEKLNKLLVTNGVALGQDLTASTALSYSLIFTSHNRESYHLNGSSFAISWNHLIYRRILDYQVTPHVDFLDENHFKPKLGLTVNVSLHF